MLLVEKFYMKKALELLLSQDIKNPGSVGVHDDITMLFSVDGVSIAPILNGKTNSVKSTKRLQVWEPMPLNLYLLFQKVSNICIGFMVAKMTTEIIHLKMTYGDAQLASNQVQGTLSN